MIELVLYTVMAVVGYFIGAGMIRPQMEKSFKDESRLARLKKQKPFISFCASKGLSLDSITWEAFLPHIDEWVAKTKKRIIIMLVIMVPAFVILQGIARGIGKSLY